MEVFGEHEVVQRLRHFLPVDGHQPVVHPVPRKRVAGRGRLRKFVLVVRKPQVEPATVNVELASEVPARHRRALDVPAGATCAPRRVPDGGCRFVGLRALPQCKIVGVALAAQLCLTRGFEGIERLVGERPVGGPTADVEVHIARGIRICWRRICMTGLDQLGNELVHLRNRRGRPRLVRRRRNADRRVCRREFELHPVRKRPPRLVVGRVDQHLVVDIGDVAHECDAVGCCKPAPQHIEGERGPEVADVWARLHRGSTNVDADLASLEGREVAQRLRLGVIEPEYHGIKTTGARVRRSCVRGRHALREGRPV